MGQTGIDSNPFFLTQSSNNGLKPVLRYTEKANLEFPVSGSNPGDTSAILLEPGVIMSNVENDLYRIEGICEPGELGIAKYSAFIPQNIMGGRYFIEPGLFDGNVFMGLSVYNVNNPYEIDGVQMWYDQVLGEFWVKRVVPGGVQAPWAAYFYVPGTYSQGSITQDGLSIELRHFPLGWFNNPNEILDLVLDLPLEVNVGEHLINPGQYELQDYCNRYCSRGLELDPNYPIWNNQYNKKLYYLTY